MQSEAVRVTRAQARVEKEVDEADIAASEQSDCSPTPLDHIFDFSDDLYEDYSVATSVAELGGTCPDLVAGDTFTPPTIDSDT